MRSVNVRFEGGDGKEYGVVSMSVADLVRQLCSEFRAIAPLEMLNEKLREGKRDWGQAGARYWDGFELSRSEFDEVVAEIENRSGLTVVETPDWVEDFSEWAMWRIYARIGVPDAPVRAYVEAMRPLKAALKPIERRLLELSMIPEGDAVREAEMNELLVARIKLDQQQRPITDRLNKATDPYAARARLSTTVRGLAAPVESQISLIDETVESVLERLEYVLWDRELRLESAEQDAAQRLVAELREWDPERWLDEVTLRSEEWARVRNKARDVVRVCGFGNVVPDHL
jgi:hypothetical protein